MDFPRLFTVTMVRHIVNKEFQCFAEEYDFRHVTSSPLYPQSNGKAEKGVHIVKQFLKKAHDSNSDPYLALLSYPASPLEHVPC